MDNGYRTVMTGSPDQAELLRQGYTIHEQDEMHTLLHRGRRSTDKPAELDVLKRRRALEDELLLALSDELFEARVVNFDGCRRLDISQLRWILDEFRKRVMASGGGRSIVTGRL